MKSLPLFMAGFVTFLGGGALTMCAIGLVPPLPFTWTGFLLGAAFMAAGCAMLEFSTETEKEERDNEAIHRRYRHHSGGHR